MKIVNFFPRGFKGDKIVSVYWFVILFIVAAAIAYMVISFYGKPYDIRGAEADFLTTRMADCLSEAGYLKESVLLKDFQDNFLEKCRINFQTEDVYGWREQGQYYLETNIFNFVSGQLISSFNAGNSNLKDSCKLDGETLPVCFEETLYSIDKNNNQYKIDILSIVKKTQKNVQ